MKTVHKSTHINILNLNARIKIHGKIARQVWGRIFYFCQAIDPDGSGKVYILVPEVLTLFNISRATFYRWLKEGKAAGAFREYQRIDKYTERIVLGSKTAICKKLKITDWDSTTEIRLWQLLSGPWKWTNTTKELKPIKLREWITQAQASWMQRRSIKAAQKEEANRIKNKRKRRKPFKPKFSGGNGKLASQYTQKRNVYFSRRHLPTGASQKGIGDSLGISECTVQRHLKGVERVQIMNKVNPLEGQEALFIAQETWGKSPIFERKGEYYRYGTNLYDLDYLNHKSQFTQRLKYKFKLLLEKATAPDIEHKNNLYKFLSYSEILENLIEFELDPLDHICLDVLLRIKSRSFKLFLDAVKKELKRLKRESHRELSG